MEEYYKDIPETNSLDYMEGIDIIETVKSRIDESFKGLKKDEDSNEIQRLRRQWSRSFVKVIPSLRSISTSGNKGIFELIEKMESYASELDFHLSGDSYLGAIYSSLAQMLFVEEMSKEQIEKLIQDRPDVAFIHGILKTGGDKILEIDKMSNDEIIKFGDKYLRDSWEQNKGGANNYEGWKTHNAMIIWDALFKHLKLEDLTDEEILNFGEKHNDGELWRYLFERREDKWMSLDQQTRNSIADRIAKSYAKAIGREPNEVLNYGGPIYKPISWLKNQN